MKWLLDNGCQFPNLYFEYYAVDFRGVAINANLPNNSIILKVHPKCLLTIEDAKKSDIGQKISRSGYRLRSTHSYVAAFLLEQRKLGPGSYWWPYIDILPKSYRHMPICMDEDELKELTGSLVLEEVKERRESYKAEYEQICSHLPEFSEYSLEDFFWARLVGYLLGVHPHAHMYTLGCPDSYFRHFQTREQNLVDGIASLILR